MLVVVVAVFATMSLPYRLALVYWIVTRSTNDSHWLMMFCGVALYVNAAVNPIFYNAMSANFRNSFRDQLACCRCCRKYTHELHTALVATTT